MTRQKNAQNWINDHVVIATVGFSQPESDSIANAIRQDITGWIDETDESDDVESNVELDSDGFVTWDCYDGLPFLIKHNGISVNLTFRPAFFPEEGLYRAVADGDEDSFMVEWNGTAERCDWRTPCRIVTLDEYNAENVGNAHAHVIPVAQAESRTVDLLGRKIYGSAIPSRQLSLFDKTDYRRTSPGSLAVIRRENGEVISGIIDIANRYKTMKKPQFMFTEHDTGSSFCIPNRCCTLTWAGDIAVIALDEREMFRNTALWGMFASCRLF